MTLDFFKGWRRKAGVVTLVMACVFAGGWVRSGTTGERLAFQTQNQIHFFGSNVGVLSYSTATGIQQSPVPVYLNWVAQPQEPQNVVMQRDENWGIIHYTKATSVTPPRLVFQSLELPYWSITIPLTLLSAILLLWPRKRPSPN